MKRILSFVLIAIVATMIVNLPSVFADGALDSLVSIASKARTQVQFQMDRSQNVSDDLKALFDQGSQETEMLISAVKQGNVAEAKQHFLSAMNSFKQVSVGLAQPQDAVAPKATLVPQVSQTTLTSYKNSIDRTEKYAGMLKDLVAKNNFEVDFTKVDTLIQNARTSLAAHDISTVDKIFTDLKLALTDIQNAIKDQTIQRQNDRAKSFASEYIAKIDAMLLQANQLGLSDEDVAKLTKAKEEIASTTDPNMLIVLIKRYSINFAVNVPPSQNQQNMTDVSKPDARVAAENQTSQSNQNVNESVKSEEQKPVEQKQEQPTQKENTKSQNPEISKFEARLAAIEPYVDDSIKPRFDTVQSLLAKLKNQETSSNADYLRTVKMLDFLIDNLEKRVDSMQEQIKNKSDGSANGSNQENKKSDNEKRNRK